MPLTCNRDGELDEVMPKLMRRARRLCANASDADDLVQETVLNVLLAQQAGRPIRHLPQYCMTVLRHQAYRHWRKTQPAEPLTDDMARVLPDAPLRLACAETQAAIARLPAAQAELMTLVAAGEVAPAQLARITGVPVGTVMSRLARARASLRETLDLSESAAGSDFLP